MWEVYNSICPKVSCQQTTTEYVVQNTVIIILKLCPSFSILGIGDGRLLVSFVPILEQRTAKLTLTDRVLDILNLITLFAVFPEKCIHVVNKTALITEGCHSKPNYIHDFYLIYLNFYDECII